MTKTRTPRFLILLPALAAGPLACGGPEVQTSPLLKAPPGSELMVDRSESDRPDWIAQPPKEKDGYLFFSGGEEGYSDYAHGFRMAKAEAIQELSESVMLTWNSLLQSSDVARNKDQLEQYGRNFQELAIETIRLTALDTEERYYEKVAVKTGYGIENRYNCFVLLRIPSYEWQAAQARALEDLRRRAQGEGDTSAEEFIDDAIERIDELSR